MRIIFMGTPDFALPTFKKLLESQHEIVAVYTQKPKSAGRGMEVKLSAVHDLAEKFHLDVFTPDTLRDEAEIQKLEALHADIAIVVAYGMILPDEALRAQRLGCLNLHPSALPRWRGAAPMQRTLMAGDKDTEICIMQMDTGLDTGDVLMKQKLAIPENADMKWLHDTAAEMGAELMMKVLEQFSSGGITRIKQSEEGVTYAKKLTRDDERLELKSSGAEILNHIRALSPVPGAFFEHEGVKYKVFAAEFSATASSEGLNLKCADGFILPKVIQKPGKTRMNIEDFLRGNKTFSGAVI